MTLASGKLRHLVTIQGITYTKDAAGLTRETWSTLPGMGKVYAAIEPLSAREFVQSASEQNAVSARITIRYRPNLPVRFRILHKAKIYNPAGVLSDKESGMEYLTIPVSTGLNAG